MKILKIKTSHKTVFKGEKKQLHCHSHHICINQDLGKESKAILRFVMNYLDTEVKCLLLEDLME